MRHEHAFDMLLRNILVDEGNRDNRQNINRRGRKAIGKRRPPPRFRNSVFRNASRNVYAQGQDARLIPQRSSSPNLTSLHARIQGWTAPPVLNYSQHTAPHLLGRGWSDSLPVPRLLCSNNSAFPNVKTNYLSFPHQNALVRSDATPLSVDALALSQPNHHVSRSIDVVCPNVGTQGDPIPSQGTMVPVSAARLGARACGSVRGSDTLHQMLKTPSSSKENDDDAFVSEGAVHASNAGERNDAVPENANSGLWSRFGDCGKDYSEAGRIDANSRTDLHNSQDMQPPRRTLRVKAEAGTSLRSDGGSLLRSYLTRNNTNSSLELYDGERAPAQNKAVRNEATTREIVHDADGSSTHNKVLRICESTEKNAHEVNVDLLRNSAVIKAGRASSSVCNADGIAVVRSVERSKTNMASNIPDVAGLAMQQKTKKFGEGYGHVLGGVGLRAYSDTMLDDIDRADLCTARLAHFAAQNLSKIDKLSLI